MSTRSPIILALDFGLSGPSRSDDHAFRGGLTTFIGFSRIIGALRVNRDIRDTECVERLEIDERGFTVILNTVKRAPVQKKAKRRKKKAGKR